MATPGSPAPDDERTTCIGALARALAGTPAATAAADALRALPHLDDDGRARVSRRVIGASVLRVRLAWLAALDLGPGDEARARPDVAATLLDAYVRHEELGAPPPRPWPSDARIRLRVERGCPDALADALVDSLGLDEADAFLAASNAPGPRTLRANALRTTRDALVDVLGREGIRTRPGLHAPTAVHVDGKANLFGSAAWRAGLFEVQDEGSQLIALACGARPGDVVVDLCAGRGGKTLALAAQMDDRGALYAHDVDARTTHDLRTRLARAGVRCVREGLPAPASADVVLVDAPCTSTGVLRRSPELRFSFDPGAVPALVDTQRALVAQAAALVRPGGTVVYATCSVLRAENEDVVRHAADDHALVWEELRRVSPAHEGTDGFFWARARRVGSRA